MLRKTNKGFYTLTTLSNFKNLVHGFSTKDFGDVRFKIAGTKKNREKLAKVLKENFKLVATLRKNKGKTILYFPQSQISDLWKIVLSYVLPEYKYKFPETRRDYTPSALLRG